MEEKRQFRILQEVDSDLNPIESVAVTEFIPDDNSDRFVKWFGSTIVAKEWIDDNGIFASEF